MKINISVQFFCIVNAERETQIYVHVNHDHTSCQNKRHNAEGSVKQPGLFAHVNLMLIHSCPSLIIFSASTIMDRLLIKYGLKRMKYT